VKYPHIFCLLASSFNGLEFWQISKALPVPELKPGRPSSKLLRRPLWFTKLVYRVVSGPGCGTVYIHLALYGAVLTCWTIPVTCCVLLVDETRKSKKSQTSRE